MVLLHNVQGQPDQTWGSSDGTVASSHGPLDVVATADGAANRDGGDVGALLGIAFVAALGVLIIVSVARTLITTRSRRGAPHRHPSALSPPATTALLSRTVVLRI